MWRHLRFLSTDTRDCIVLWLVYIDEMCMVMVCDTLVAWHGPLLEVDADADAARGVATPRRRARASRVFCSVRDFGFVR